MKITIEDVPNRDNPLVIEDVQDFYIVTRAAELMKNKAGDLAIQIAVKSGSSFSSGIVGIREIVKELRQIVDELGRVLPPVNITWQGSEESQEIVNEDTRQYDLPM